MRTTRKVATALLTAVLAALFLLFWMRAPYVVAIGAAAVLGFSVLAIRTSADNAPAREADEAWLAAAPDLPPASERRVMEAGQELAAARAEPKPRREAAPGASASNESTDAQPGPAGAVRKR